MDDNSTDSNQTTNCSAAVLRNGDPNGARSGTVGVQSRQRRVIAAAMSAAVAAGLSLVSLRSMAADPFGTVTAFPPDAGASLAGDVVQWQGELLANRATAGFTAFNPTTGAAKLSLLITVNPVKTMTVFNGQLAWIDATTNVVKTANAGGVVTALTGTVPATADSMLAVGTQLWISRAGGIDRYTPTATALGSPTPLPTTFGAASVLRMAAGPDGTIWVVEKNAAGVDTLGRYNNTGTPAGIGFNFASTASDPSAIVAGADGAMWIIQAGLNAVARIDAVSFAATEIVLPTGSNATSLALGSDSGVWVTETALNSVSRLTWSQGNFTRTPVLAPNSSSSSGSSGSSGATDASGSFGLKSVIAGPDGNMWAVGTTANRIAKFGSVPSSTTLAVAGANTTSTVAVSTTTLPGAVPAPPTTAPTAISQTTTTSTSQTTATSTTPTTPTTTTTTPTTTTPTTITPSTTTKAPTTTTRVTTTIPVASPAVIAKTPASNASKVCIKSVKRKVKEGKKLVTKTVCTRYKVV